MKDYYCIDDVIIIDNYDITILRNYKLHYYADDQISKQEIYNHEKVLRIQVLMPVYIANIAISSLDVNNHGDATYIIDKD